MIKKIIAISLWILLFAFQGFAQNPDGNFNNLSFIGLTKGNGASDYFGWGLNTNRAWDIRPNSTNNIGALVINHHVGLTFSAHSSYGGIRFYNQGYPIGPLEPSTGATMVMSINNNAVGIGTPYPRVLLDVGADISNGKLGAVLGRLPEGDSAGEGTFLGVRGYSTILVPGTYSIKSFALEHSFYGVTNSSINFFRGGDSENGSIAFNTGKNVERMRLENNGDVSIVTPNAKFLVNGNILATSIKVQNQVWPDYVFEPAYEKLTLPELEKFIQTNKHLPEIPSAKTVAKDGVDLGDMNAKLLKKIEELTLYTIDQDKRLNKKDKDFSELKEKMNGLEAKLEKLISAQKN